MAFYEVRRTLLDHINGHHIQRGTVVETEDDLWVARFGNDLKLMSVVPVRAKPISISGTEEGNSADKAQKAVVAEAVKEPEKKPEPEVETAPAQEKVVRRQTTKVVTGADSDAK